MFDRHFKLFTRGAGFISDSDTQEYRECPFCFQVISTFDLTARHIAIHLIRIALFTLPRSTGIEVEQDERSTVSNQNATRSGYIVLEELRLQISDSLSSSDLSSIPDVEAEMMHRQALAGKETMPEDDYSKGFKTLVIPPRNRILECPFTFLFCFMKFSSLEERIEHSLSHFKRIGPSTSNICCFCEQTFNHPGGEQSWRQRMQHVALHHQLGSKLEYSRPDFQLFDYLWRNKLISTVEYTNLKGNFNPARMEY